MTTKQLLKKIKLSDSDMQQIKDAVQKAESKTTGEIALALTAESESYSFWELIASICVSTIVFAILLPFASGINNLYESHFWTQPIWFLPAFYVITSFVTILIAFAFMNVPCIDRIIIPELVENCISISLGASIITENSSRDFETIYKQTDECVYLSKKFQGNKMTFVDELLNNQNAKEKNFYR